MGNNTRQIVVQWGSPPDGYGVITVDGTFCNACNAQLSVKIPVITNNTEISGPDVVCVGDIQEFELPLWGSTDYHWYTSNNNGIQFLQAETPNKTLARFTSPGQHSISATYECEALECGLFRSTKVINVKDTLRIVSNDDNLCIGAVGTYTTNDGMLSDYILSTIEDSSGNLWIATQGGLNRLNLQTGSLIGFPYDRLGHLMRFNEGQPLLARDGTLYFNTTAGILYFDPQEISNSNFAPEIVIQALYISGARRYIQGKETIRILPSDGIRVQFAATDLTAPEQILYSYRLDGVDKDWIHLGHQATLSIPPLRPGRYTLRIRSTNGDGLEVENERDLVFLVRRNFFQSNWAGLLYLLLAASIVFLVLRFHKKRNASPEGPGDPLLRGLHGDDLRFAQAYTTFIREHLDDSGLDVPQMCEAMSVSRSVLFEKCRALLDTTPAIFLRRLRMERAQALIREGGRTMADISYSVGFNDPHYFSKVFKQQTGMTPTEYRNSLKQDPT